MCKNHGQALMGLGITLVILGSLSVIIGIASAASFNWDLWSRIGAPIWTGLFIILTGAMGIMSGRNLGQYVQNSGFVTAFLTLSIIGIFVAIVQQSINGVGGSLLGWCYVDAIQDAINNDSASRWCQAAAAIHWTCIALGFLEMVVCFAGSIVGCVVGCSCCAPQPAPPMVIMQPPPNGANMPVTVINAGTPGAYAYPQAGYAQQPGGAPAAYLPPPTQQSPPYPGEQKTGAPV